MLMVILMHTVCAIDKATFIFFAVYDTKIKTLPRTDITSLTFTNGMTLSYIPVLDAEVLFEAFGCKSDARRWQFVHHV